jgi:hypothetical protein
MRNTHDIIGLTVMTASVVSVNIDAVNGKQQQKVVGRRQTS